MSSYSKGKLDLVDPLGTSLWVGMAFCGIVLVTCRTSLHVTTHVTSMIRKVLVSLESRGFAWGINMSRSGMFRPVHCALQVTPTQGIPSRLSK